LSDSDWVQQAMRAHEGPLLRYAASITGDLERARDVVQEVFLKLYQADRAQVAPHLAPWLYTVARNRALTMRKKEARMTPLLDGQANAIASTQAGPGELAEASEQRLLLAGALRRLPEQQQEACRLKFQNGLSYREISQIMGVSLGTVSNLITKALDAVRQELRAGFDPAREV